MQDQRSDLTANLLVIMMYRTLYVLYCLSVMNVIFPNIQLFPRLKIIPSFSGHFPGKPGWLSQFPLASQFPLIHGIGQNCPQSHHIFFWRPLSSSFSLHVWPSTWLTQCMFDTVHAWPSTCLTQYMFDPVHVWPSTCLTQYMFDPVHVWHSTCLTQYMLDPVHAWPCTCLTRYMLDPVQIHAWLLALVGHLACKKVHCSKEVVSWAASLSIRD